MNISKTIIIKAQNEIEANKRVFLLKMLNENIEFSNLELLATKSQKKGINEKIRKNAKWI